MKVKASSLIRQNRPLYEQLLRMLLERFPYASILAADSRAKTYSVNRALTSVSEGGTFAGRGFVVKVFDGAHWSEHSFSQISREALPDILGEVQKTVALSETLLPDQLTENVYSAPEEEPQTFVGSTDYEIDPEELGDDVILSRMTAVRDRGLAFSDRLLNCIVRCDWCRTSKLFLAPGRELEQNILWATGSILAAAARGEEIKTSYRPFSNLGGMELLDQLEEGAEEVAATVIALLDSLPMVPGEYDCICTPEVTGMIVHEAFGHGVEMDMFVKKRALAEQYIGDYVASPLVNMHDGAATLPQTGTYFFDDEGTMAHDTLVIEKGILKSGISDYQSARVLGTEPTGNGRRESYRRKAYTRMTNTYFEGGNDRLEDMIASVKYGFLLEEPASGMEDPKNWGIQCMVNYAREIKDGQLTGRIFSPVVLTGYVPDLLRSITMMSPDVQLSGSGMCGKGYKEWVKVSDGGSFIRARIRLG